MKLRPMHDWVFIELEEQEKTYEGSSIVRVADNPLRIGKVVDLGKGRQYPDKYVPTELKVGDRVVFFIAATECGSGPSVNYKLGGNQRLIRETDVLMVVEGKLKVEV